MFDRLDRFGLPVKYAILGCLAGLIWIVVSALFDYRTESGPLLTLAAFTLGGFIGGWLRQRAGKTK